MEQAPRPESSPESIDAPGHVRPILRVMRMLGRLMPSDASGENQRAVQMFARMNRLKDVTSGLALRRTLGRFGKQPVWPVTSGTYVVSDPKGAVAICTLTSEELLPELAQIPGVAIVGRVIVPNLGIEKIIQNITANPNIRFLLLCGKESQVFHPAQALSQLFSSGVDAERRIVGAVGHLPVLKNVDPAQIAHFLEQIELIEMVGVTDRTMLESKVRELCARSPGALDDTRALPFDTREGNVDDAFAKLPVSGKRSRIEYDRLGFFVISLDRKTNEIILRHYHSDHRPGYEVRARSAESALRPALAQGIVSQLDHAAYLGAELAKAEAALKLGLVYEQDKPLRAAS